jgi:hypothetical protein
LKRHPDGDAYAQYLDGFGPFDHLPGEIRIELFSPKPAIPATCDEREAATIYQAYRDQSP